jgi:hypothetical protein
MDIFYRKVAVSERLPQVEKWFHVIGEDENVDLCPFRFNEFFATDTIGQREVKYWLEEITDTSHQIEKLEAEKKELLTLMVTMKDSFDNKAWVTSMELQSFSKQIESLIQKHK